MSRDDQDYIDFLLSLPNGVKRYSLEVADAIDHHVDAVTSALRDSLSSSSWLPEAARPLPPPPQKLSTNAAQNTLQRAHSWVSNHKKGSIAAILLIGAASYFLYRHRRDRSKKRRARRAGNGARKDVIILSGKVNDLIIQSISLDLERRGFIVYIVADSHEDKASIQSMARPDIRSLQLDILDVRIMLSSKDRSVTRPADMKQASKCQEQLKEFNTFLSTLHRPFAGISSNRLRLVGMVVIPDTDYAQGSLDKVPLDYWSDNLNTKVLGTVATVRAIQPILCEHKSRILLVLPGTIAPLKPPLHAIESSVVAALEAYIQTLREELQPSGVAVSLLKLGVVHEASYNRNPTSGREWIDSPAGPSQSRGQTLGSQSHSLSTGIRLKESSLQNLHHTVFDALTTPRPRKVWRAGAGSLIYDVVGRWVPSGLVGYMLGFQRRVDIGINVEQPVTGWEVAEWARPQNVP